MLRSLERLGYDLDGLLASAGLTRSDVENPDAYISPQACAAVFCRAHAERRVRNLALQLAVDAPIGTTPLLDYLIASSDSDRDSIVSSATCVWSIRGSGLPSKIAATLFASSSRGRGRSRTSSPFRSASCDSAAKRTVR